MTFDVCEFSSKMVFKKIRSFQLSDFSSLNSRRESNVNSVIDDENENVEDSVDVITDNLGYIGRYQVLLGLLFALLELPHAWCMLLHKFLAPPVDHWCARPDTLSHWSMAEWRNFSSPPGDSCHIYNRSYSVYADVNFSDVYPPSTISHDLIPCSSWHFDNSWYLNTIRQKFNLVCDDAILNNVASSTFFAGTGVGVFIAGLLSDKIGRKKTILIFIALFFASGVTAAFATTYELWLAARFLWGAASLGLRAVKTVMSLEMVGSKWRAIICVGLIEGGWTIGYLSLAGLAYAIPNAFYLQVLVACGILPFAPLLLFMTESPKWLLATGRVPECRQALQKIMKINGIEKDVIIPEIEDDKNAKASVLDLFRTPMIRRNTVIISLAWFALGTLYFGLSLNMPNFDGNTYFIFFLTGLVEIPADIIPFVLLNKFGRRPNLAGHYIVGGLLCMATAAVPLGRFVYEWPIVVLAMTGKYVSQVCWGIVYTYTNELFPTVIRSAALSVACSMARLGSMSAPYIASLSSIHPVLPIFVFGTITFIMGLQAIALPETNNKKLPDTLQEGELFLKKNNPMKCC